MENIAGHKLLAISCCRLICLQLAAAAATGTRQQAAGREDVASGREQAAGELSRHLAETNSMTSLNINTRLVIALGIVIDFS